MDVLELDLHVHAGSELWGTPQSDFVRALQARGVTLAGLLDHAEFYVDDKPSWIADSTEARRAKGGKFYSGDIEGLKSFYDDIESLKRSSDLNIVAGMELGDIEGTPEAFFEFPQYLSHCFGVSSEESGESFGQKAAGRIRRFGEKVRHAGKPGIINHPFRSRIGHYKELVEAGQAPSPEAFITADDIARMVDALAEYGLFLEVNLGTFAGMEECEPAVGLGVHAMQLVVEANAHLSIGSDSHQPPPPTFSPAVTRLIRESGLREWHFGRIVDELRGPRPGE